MAHVRQATQGRKSLANPQPFQRELWGRVHVFAHNGDIAPGEGGGRSVPARHRAMGETDSEAVFCRFLDRLEARVDPKLVSADRAIEAEFAGFCSALRELGPANIICASAGCLLVHADRRMQSSGRIEPPGLWLLERSCETHVDGSVRTGAVSISGAATKVALVASVLLTDEDWAPLERGAILFLDGGHVERWPCD